MSKKDYCPFGLEIKRTSVILMDSFKIFRPYNVPGTAETHANNSKQFSLPLISLGCGRMCLNADAKE